ncbi:MAG: hypothetical protein ACLPV8_25500 [Steroidobacteraceae bacterium]
MAKQKAPVAAPADSLRELTEQAQKQPGLAQLLTLLRQVQESERTIREMDPASDYAVGGTLGHT